jgi:hypothetical protein
MKDLPGAGSHCGRCVESLSALRMTRNGRMAPVYDWFTEGFDTLDLKEARALLEELAA